jgi:hypothetical protein
MQVTVTIRTVEQQFAGGTVGGNFRIEVAAAADPGTIVNEYEGAGPSTEFDLEDGETYIARGVRLDAGGATLGPVAVLQFTAGADLVAIDVADTISATSSPAARARASKK